MKIIFKKKAFSSSSNCPLSDSTIFIVNKFQYVWGDRELGLWTGMPPTPDRRQAECQTDATDIITFAALVGDKIVMYVWPRWKIAFISDLSKKYGEQSNCPNRYHYCSA